MKLGEVIQVNGELYEVHRTMRVREGLQAELIREYWHCTHTFQKDGMLYFVRAIESVDFEEIPN